MDKRPSGDHLAQGKRRDLHPLPRKRAGIPHPQPQKRPVKGGGISGWEPLVGKLTQDDHFSTISSPTKPRWLWLESYLPACTRQHLRLKKCMHFWEEDLPRKKMTPCGGGELEKEGARAKKRRHLKEDNGWQPQENPTLSTLL